MPRRVRMEALSEVRLTAPHRGALFGRMADGFLGGFGLAHRVGGFRYWGDVAPSKGPDRVSLSVVVVGGVVDVVGTASLWA